MIPQDFLSHQSKIKKLWELLQPSRAYADMTKCNMGSWNRKMLENKKTYWIKYGKRIWIDISPKTQMVRKHMKWCLKYNIMRQMQIIPTRTAILKYSKCWSLHGKTEVFKYCCIVNWCILFGSLTDLQKIKPCEPLITLLDLCKRT